VSPFSRRFLGIALGASLAVNLFLAGFIVASVINRGWHHHGPPHGRLALRAAFHDLDPATRTTVEAIWRGRLPEIRSKLEAIRTARREFRAALHRDDIDPAAVQAAFQRVHDARGAAQQVIHQTIRAIGEKLTPAQRRKFYRTVFERRRWRRDRPGDRRRPPQARDRD
jgi:Spy/CpxP family protein refolding chaperone